MDFFYLQGGITNTGRKRLFICDTLYCSKVGSHVRFEGDLYEITTSILASKDSEFYKLVIFAWGAEPVRPDEIFAKIERKEESNAE